LKTIFFICLLVLSTSLTAYTTNTSLNTQDFDISGGSLSTPVNNLSLPGDDTIMDFSTSISSSKQDSIFVSTDIMYWKAREAGADNWAQNISSPGTEQSAEILGVPFNNDLGLRIGLGYQNNNDWDAGIYYTRYNTDANDTAYGNIYSSYLGNFYAGNTDGTNVGPAYASGEIDWGINFNTIDIEIGRTFFFYHIMNLHPYIGLKLASIDQSIDTNWYNPINITTFTSATENITNDFKGIGPSIGLDTSFILYKKSNHTISIFGNFAAALLYANWHFSDQYNNDQPTAITIDNGSSTGAAPMLDGAIGLEWQSDFTKVNTKIRLGYEEQIWYDQLKFYSFNMGQMHDNLSLQGLTLGISVNFK
jgi:hypothetical protein